MMKVTNLGSGLMLGLLVGSLANCGATEGATPGEELGSQRLRGGVTHTPDPARELFINHLSVVEDTSYTRWAPGKKDTDPEGGWSFGRLVDNMLDSSRQTSAGRSQFVMSWLKTWETDQTINGQVVASRPAIRTLVIDPWKAASGCSTASASNDLSCTLDMGKAPFRLLAIVNRPDLRRLPTSSGYQGTGGEGRFVFGVLGPTGNALQFTVIFEYKLPVSSRSDIISWAERWHKLGEKSFGSGYNSELHNVTREFTKYKADRGQYNALLQIRTNEASLAVAGSDPDNTPSTKMWEMREFVLDESGSAHRLVPDTMKKEPAIALSGSAALGSWAQANAASILAGTYTVPDTYNGQPFLAGSSITPRAFVWDVPGVSDAVRDKLAVGTCNGCHTNETATDFLHVRNRAPGQVAQPSALLAGELTGIRKSDFITLLNSDDVEVVDGPGIDD